jgi:hypothetical protein
MSTLDAIRGRVEQETCSEPRRGYHWFRCTPADTEISSEDAEQLIYSLNIEDEQLAQHRFARNYVPIRKIVESVHRICAPLNRYQYSSKDFVICCYNFALDAYCDSISALTVCDSLVSIREDIISSYKSPAAHTVSSPEQCTPTASPTTDHRRTPSTRRRIWKYYFSRAGKTYKIIYQNPLQYVDQLVRLAMDDNHMSQSRASEALSNSECVFPEDEREALHQMQYSEQASNVMYDTRAHLFGFDKGHYSSSSASSQILIPEILFVLARFVRFVDHAITYSRAPKTASEIENSTLRLYSEIDNDYKSNAQSSAASSSSSPSPSPSPSSLQLSDIHENSQNLITEQGDKTQCSVITTSLCSNPFVTEHTKSNCYSIASTSNTNNHQQLISKTEIKQISPADILEKKYIDFPVLIDVNLESKTIESSIFFNESFFLIHSS